MSQTRVMTPAAPLLPPPPAPPAPAPRTTPAPPPITVPPPPAISPARGRGLWISMLMLGSVGVAVGVLGFVLANAADRSNDRTFAEEIASLSGADPQMKAGQLGPRADQVEQAVRSFWTASQATVDRQQDLTALFDKAVAQAGAGHTAKAKALIRERAGSLIRKFEQATKVERAARQELSQAVTDLQEVLS